MFCYGTIQGILVSNELNFCMHTFHSDERAIVSVGDTVFGQIVAISNTPMELLRPVDHCLHRRHQSKPGVSVLTVVTIKQNVNKPK